MTYKPYDFSDDVCDDSCVEWFMDFLPGNTEGYMNLEATACAAINCCTQYTEATSTNAEN